MNFKNHFKHFYFFVITTFYLVACVTTKKDTATEIYLPAPIQQVKLGMPMSAILQLRTKVYVVNSVQETPRHVYTEDIENEDINSIYYLFNKEEPKKLVEINILHKSPEAAQNNINQHFGEQKNNKQNQWHKTLKDGTLIHATWVKQKVFIFVDDKDNEPKNEKPAEE